MLRIEGIKCPPGADQGLLLKKAARLLRCKPEDIRRFTVLRRAVDAREGLQLVYTLAVELADEGAALRRCRSRAVSAYAPAVYHLPPGSV